MATYTQNIANWFGGLSSDKYTPNRGGFFDNKNTEGNKNTRELTLSNIDSSPSNPLSAGFIIDKIGSNYLTQDNKLVNTSGSVVYTLPGGTPRRGGSIKSETGLDTGVYTEYEFKIDSDGKIYRWISGTPSGATNNATLTNTLKENAPINTIGNGFFIGASNELYFVSCQIDTWDISKIIVLGNNEEIVSLTIRGDIMYIYTNNELGGTIYVRQYNIVDISNELPDLNRKIVLTNNYIANAVLGPEYDFMITYENTSDKVCNKIWAVSGLNAQVQYKNNSLEGGFKSNYFNDIVSDNGDIYMRWGNSSGDTDIVSYNSNVPGLPKSLQKTYGVSGIVSNLLKYDGGVKYWNRNGGNVSFYSIENNKYSSSGYVILNPFFGNLQSNKKSVKKIRIGLKNTVNTNIKTYLSINDGEYILVGTGDDNGLGRHTFNTYYDFFKLQVKLELNTINSNDTPILYDFTLIYDEIENDL